MADGVTPMHSVILLSVGTGVMEMWRHQTSKWFIVERLKLLNITKTYLKAISRINLIFYYSKVGK